MLFSESPDTARLPVKKRHTTAGIVFIILSAISLILSFFKTGGFAPVTLMLSSCFAFCAVLCFIRLKYTALKCAWVFYFALTVPTGLNSNVFGAVTFYLYKSEIRPGANTVFWNFAVLFLYLCVIFFSVLIMKRERIYITAKSLISLSLIYMLSWLLSNLAVLYNKSAGSVLQSLSSVLDIAFLILLSLMLITGFRKKRKAL